MSCFTPFLLKYAPPISLVLKKNKNAFIWNEYSLLFLDVRQHVEYKYMVELCLFYDFHWNMILLSDKATY